MKEYADLCASGNVIGQLYVYIPENADTDNNIDKIQTFFNDYYDGSGDIYVQVGQIKDESELFETADYYVATKVNETVRYTCLADLYGVKILSGADLPNVFWGID